MSCQIHSSGKLRTEVNDWPWFCRGVSRLPGQMSLAAWRLNLIALGVLGTVFSSVLKIIHRLRVVALCWRLPTGGQHPRELSSCYIREVSVCDLQIYSHCTLSWVLMWGMLCPGTDSVTAEVPRRCWLPWNNPVTGGTRALESQAWAGHIQCPAGDLGHASPQM